MNIAYAEDSQTPTSLVTIPTSPIATATLDPTIPTVTTTPELLTQDLGNPPDLLATVSALQFSLTESATIDENDRINIQPTLSTIELYLSDVLQQQERLLRMQVIGFCVTGIIILSVVLYLITLSRRTSAVQTKEKQSSIPAKPQNQKNASENVELERRLNLAEKEAALAKKTSQEAFSQIRNLETKLVEQENIILELKQSSNPDFGPRKHQEAKSKENLIPHPNVELKTQTGFDEEKNLTLKLLQVYNELAKREGEKFIPFDEFINNTIARKLAQNESEVYKILEYIIQKYPGAIRIETIRGKTGKHIAIFKEYLQ